MIQVKYSWIGASKFSNLAAEAFTILWCLLFAWRFLLPKPFQLFQPFQQQEARTSWPQRMFEWLVLNSHGIENWASRPCMRAHLDDTSVAPSTIIFSCITESKIGFSKKSHSSCLSWLPAHQQASHRLTSLLLKVPFQGNCSGCGPCGEDCLKKVQTWIS